MSKDKEKAKEYNRKYKYGLSNKDYLILLFKQNNLCAICFKPEVAKSSGNNKVKELSVDHNHSTGKVRSLLCHKCNMLLGYVNDNSHLLRTAAEYLDKFNN